MNTFVLLATYSGFTSLGRVHDLLQEQSVVEDNIEKLGWAFFQKKKKEKISLARLSLI